MADDNLAPGAAQAGAQTGANPQQDLQVKVPDDVQKGVYSNAVSVNVNSNEVVVDFGYLLPNTPKPIIEVVSRVNMNQRTAESFLQVLAGAMDDFKKRQEALAQQQAAPQVQPAPAPQPQPQPMPAPMPQPMGPQPMTPGMSIGPDPMMPPLPQNA